MSDTTKTTLSLEDQLAQLRAENEKLRASQGAGLVPKGQPSIKAGIVHFARIGGLTGLSLNPEAFAALRQNFAAACKLYDTVGDARMRSDYAARPAYVAPRGR
jgi:hypothetical protein